MVLMKQMFSFFLTGVEAEGERVEGQGGRTKEKREGAKWTVIVLLGRLVTCALLCGAS